MPHPEEPGSYPRAIGASFVAMALVAVLARFVQRRRKGGALVEEKSPPPRKKARYVFKGARADS